MADDFAAAARRLRQLERQIMPAARQGLEESARELVNDAKVSARTTLPRTGGYNDEVADTTRFDIRLSGGGRGVTMTITATGPDYRLDRNGRLRKPVFPRGPRDTWTWVQQRVRPGWFTRPMRAGRSKVRGQLQAEMSRITRGARRR